MTGDPRIHHCALPGCTANPPFGHRGEWYCRDHVPVAYWDNVTPRPAHLPPKPSTRIQPTLDTGGQGRLWCR